MLFITQSYNSSHHVSMFMPFIKITTSFKLSYVTPLLYPPTCSLHKEAKHNYDYFSNTLSKPPPPRMQPYRYQSRHGCSLIDISPGMLFLSLLNTVHIYTKRETIHASSKWVVRNYQIQTKRCRQLCPYLSCHHDILNCSVQLEVKVYSCEGECNSSMHLYRLSVKTKVLQNIITNFVVKLRSLSAT